MNKITKKHAYYNNQFFAKWAGLYDYEKYFFSPLRRKAAKFLGLKPPKRILDVATGTGAQAYELAKLGHEVIGVDLSPEMLKEAQKKLNKNLNLKFRQADATHLPFRNNSFDAASISLGLHDMPHEIDLMVLKEIKRVVKKGGQILIVDYNETKKHLIAKLLFPAINLYETVNWKPFIKKGLESLLKEVNLNVERETNWLGAIQIVLVRL